MLNCSSTRTRWYISTDVKRAVASYSNMIVYKRNVGKSRTAKLELERSLRWLYIALKFVHILWLNIGSNFLSLTSSIASWAFHFFYWLLFLAEWSVTNKSISPQYIWPRWNSPPYSQCVLVWCFSLPTKPTLKDPKTRQAKNPRNRSNPGKLRNQQLRRYCVPREAFTTR
jgi:hypothetical protein